MNKYILMLGVAGVALGSYAAYAGNEDTMYVGVTIVHDVSLTKTRDINLGTITLNPDANSNSETVWNYNSSGEYIAGRGNGIVSADNATVGIFTANISNPSDCDSNDGYVSCGGLSIYGNNDHWIDSLFSGDYDHYDNCAFRFKYSGSENNFIVYPSECVIGDLSSITPGTKTGTLTISYNAF
ncbi:MAG: hypothetical protein IJ689_01995 [Alphaproteobacteria bacterium]|nr:hypothetical protein [Alphaproteobacteria bacterium]